MKHQITLTKTDISKGLVLPQEITTDLAYLLGVLAGDGSIGYRLKKHEYSIKCVGNPEDEILFYKQIIAPLFKKIFGIELSLQYFDTKSTYGFRLFSKSLVFYLTKYLELPLGIKYPTLHIPNLLFDQEQLLIPFLQGIFDTDGSVALKCRYRDIPYYPVISFSSKSASFTKEIALLLRQLDFVPVEMYDYKFRDKRVKQGYTTISRLELNGKKNLIKWMQTIGFRNPKHLLKIKKLGLSPQIAEGGFEFGDTSC